MPAAKSAKKESLLTKVLYTYDGFKWDKEDLMDVLHWWKQAIALIMGVVCGLVPFVHMAGFLLFAIVMVTLTIMFYRSYLGVDEEDYGGHTELLAEAMPLAIGTFLLSWILVYNFAQEPSTIVF